MKVNEIFYSIQGEGYWTGTPCLFVRLAGCNLKCDFCDTQHQQGKEMTDEEIIDVCKTLSSKCEHIVITGGEPSIQLTQEFINKLIDHDYYIHVETNGTNKLPSFIHWVTLSPKYKAPTIKRASEVKVVYEGQDMSQYSDILARYRYIQPCDRKDEEKNAENIKLCVEYIKQHPEWKLSLQTQKILNVQ